MTSLKVSWSPPLRPNGEILGYLVKYETAVPNDGEMAGAGRGAEGRRGEGKGRGGKGREGKGREGKELDNNSQ